MSELIQDFNISITVSKTNLKQLINIIKNTAKEARLNFTKNGITCKYIDPTHVYMIDMTLPQTFFIKYEINTDGYISITNPKSLLKVIKDLDDTVQIHASSENYVIQDGKSKFKFAQQEIIETEQPVPKLTYDVQIEILNLSSFVKDHKKISKFCNYVIYSMTNHIMKLKFHTEDQAEGKLDESDNIKIIECKEDSNQTYGLEYVLPFLKSLDKNTYLKLEYSERKPLRFETRIGHDGVIHYYLAPRIEY
jgi:proliferating cell nuclear antigen